MSNLTPKIQDWVQKTIEERFKLKINKEKTKVIDLKADKASMDFLGFKMRWINNKNLQIQHGKKSVKKAKERIRKLTSPRMGCEPIKDLISSVNRFLVGG